MADEEDRTTGEAAESEKGAETEKTAESNKGAESEKTAETTDAGTVPEAESIPEQIREFVGTGVFWATLLILVVVAAIVAIVVQNTHDVEFEFLWLDATTPLLTVILFTALISALCVEAVTAVWRLRRRRMLSEREELRRLRGTAPGHRRWWRR